MREVEPYAVIAKMTAWGPAKDTAGTDALRSIIRQAEGMRESLDRLTSKIGEIEAMPRAPLDGGFENQKTNAEKLCAKIEFYEFAKRTLRGDAGKEGRRGDERI